MNAQTVTISGFLKESGGTSLSFANVVYDSNADQLLKVEVTDENGVFAFRDMAQRGYQLRASFGGLSDIIRSIDGLNEEVVDLGLLQFGSTGIELQEAVLTASRAIVEVKPDRTVFNVNGKINNVGSDAISLLWKEQGVTVDNNGNVTVL